MKRTEWISLESLFASQAATCERITVSNRDQRSREALQPDERGGAWAAIRRHACCSASSTNTLYLTLRESARSRGLVGLEALSGWRADSDGGTSFPFLPPIRRFITSRLKALALVVWAALLLVVDQLNQPPASDSAPKPGKISLQISNLLLALLPFFTISNPEFLDFWPVLCLSGMGLFVGGPTMPCCSDSSPTRMPPDSMHWFRCPFELPGFTPCSCAGNSGVGAPKSCSLVPRFSGLWVVSASLFCTLYGSVVGGG